MINYFKSLFSSLRPNLFILQNLIIIAIITLIFLIRKHKKRFYLKDNNQRSGNNTAVEGFTQRDSFVLKQNENIYDDFYVEIYDTLYKTITRSQWELKNILNLTDADTKNSVFLDIGSGTGYKVNELQKAGFRAFGVDNSEAMIKRSEILFPEIINKLGDIYDPMLYDKSIFTHILSMNYTIYEFKDKLSFFRNCHSWIKPNGYLVLHLVDPSTFNAVIPVYKNQWKTSSTRAVDTLVDFYDFSYHAHYEFPIDIKNIVTLKETFTDKQTKKVRQNEQTLYMESINDILKLANRSGFIFHGKTTMKDYNNDENQYLYVLERVM